MKDWKEEKTKEWKEDKQRKNETMKKLRCAIFIVSFFQFFNINGGEYRIRTDDLLHAMQAL